ncbi:hypothetical protein [Lysobacter gummosus]
MRAEQKRIPRPLFQRGNCKSKGVRVRAWTRCAFKGTRSTQPHANTKRR